MRNYTNLLCAMSALFLLFMGCGAETTETTENTQVVETVEDEVSTYNLVNIYDLLNKNPDEVIEVIGNPTIESTANFTMSDGTKKADQISNTYLDGQLEILFIDNLVARVTITPENNVRMSSSYKLDFFNLISIEGGVIPATQSPTITTYTDYQIKDIYEINAFYENDILDYAYVITSEMYK